MGTKNFLMLYVRFFKANEIGRNGGQPSTWLVMYFAKSMHITWPNPTGFTVLGISFDIMLELTRFFKMMSIRFSLFSTKFRKASFFKSNFFHSFNVCILVNNDSKVQCFIYQSS